MPRRFAEDTSVPISRSREAIDRLLRAWGADGIMWADDIARARVVLRFIWPSDGRRYVARFEVQLSTREDLEDRAKNRWGDVVPGKIAKLMDGRGRQEHRVLLLWLTALFNAIEGGLTTAEQALLPWLEGKDGRTFAEVALPRLPDLLGASADRLLPGRS
jgi:hypothetical protein